MDKQIEDVTTFEQIADGQVLHEDLGDYDGRWWLMLEPIVRLNGVVYFRSAVVSEDCEAYLDLPHLNTKESAVALAPQYIADYEWKHGRRG
jgi:hypothetical protein